ncbi:MAG: helix-turn-helix domain-containing protein [Actinobacteria bacterium]|nr:MAG: helix-turn-helix domain-containing protein [Actinomycetota bacterium]
MGHARHVVKGEPLLLTVVEAAAMLGVGRTTAYELIAGGELQVVHIGRSARVPLVAVHRYVDGLVSPPRRTIRSAPRQRTASQPPLPFIDLTRD